jgi:signal transduction histidine kinase
MDLNPLLSLARSEFSQFKKELEAKQASDARLDKVVELLDGILGALNSIAAKNLAQKIEFNPKIDIPKLDSPVVNVEVPEREVIVNVPENPITVTLPEPNITVNVPETVVNVTVEKEPQSLRKFEMKIMRDSSQLIDKCIIEEVAYG